MKRSTGVNAPAPWTESTTVPCTACSSVDFMFNPLRSEGVSPLMTLLKTGSETGTGKNKSQQTPSVWYQNKQVRSAPGVVYKEIEVNI